jgi:hypothetical protein
MLRILNCSTRNPMHPRSSSSAEPSAFVLAGTRRRTDLEDSLARAPSQAGLGSAHAQLGLLEQIQGRYAAAIHHHLIALQLKQEAHGPRDPTIGVTWNRLEEAYLASG